MYVFNSGLDRIDTVAKRFPQRGRVTNKSEYKSDDQFGTVLEMSNTITRLSSYEEPCTLGVTVTGYFMVSGYFISETKMKVSPTAMFAPDLAKGVKSIEDYVFTTLQVKHFQPRS